MCRCVILSSVLQKTVKLFSGVVMPHGSCAPTMFESSPLVMPHVPCALCPRRVSLRVPLAFVENHPSRYRTVPPHGFNLHFSMASDSQCLSCTFFVILLSLVKLPLSLRFSVNSFWEKIFEVPGMQFLESRSHCYCCVGLRWQGSW